MKRANLTSPVAARFWAKVEAQGQCWIWTAAKVGKGYGHFNQGGKPKMILAHRWAYEAMVSEIPEGLELDHLCRNKACVNPDHLEPVTHAINVARNPNAINNTCGLITHCPAGHEYNDANTRLYRGRRHCRLCARRHTADYRARKAA